MGEISFVDYSSFCLKKKPITTINHILRIF